MTYNRYRGFTIREGLKITFTKEIYHRTASGKSWRSKPSETESEAVTDAFYNNYVRAVPVFNGFFGGTCRASWGYTCAGYIPVRVTTISPDRSEKHIATFHVALD